MVPRDGFTMEYLFSFFASANFYSVFGTLVTGTSGSHQRVKPEYLESVATLIPSEEVVAAFTEIVRPILLKLLLDRKQSETVAETRDTLLPKLTSGEVRIKDAEKFVEGLDEQS